MQQTPFVMERMKTMKAENLYASFGATLIIVSGYVVLYFIYH